MTEDVGAAEQARRALTAWSSLTGSCVRAGRDGPVVHEPGHRRPVHLWPLSQVVHAAALLASNGVADDAAAALDVPRQLARHRRHGVLTAAPGGREAFYDDAAWVALAAIELARTDPARLEIAWQLLPFLRRGAIDLGDDGIGVRWKVGGTALHACSTAPIGLVAARLALLTDDAGTRSDLTRFAHRCRWFVATRLLRDDGLVADHVRADGHLDTTVWAYNQGATLALDVALSLLDEREARLRLEDARALAGRTLGHFAIDDAMWHQPPVFVAILMRELLGLDAVAPDPRWHRAVSTYADRVWREGRDPLSGLVDGAAGLGRYDAGVVLDHAGVTQLWAQLSQRP